CKTSANATAPDFSPTPKSCSSIDFPLCVLEMSGRLIGHAHIRRYELVSVRWPQTPRTRNIVARFRFLALPVHDLDHLPAPEQAINDQCQPNHERDASRSPHPQEYRGVALRRLRCKPEHEEVEEDRHRYTDTTTNHAGLNLFVTFDFRRDAELA